MPAFSLNQFTTGGSIVHTLATVAGGALHVSGPRSGKSVIGVVPGMVTVKVAKHDSEFPNASMLTPGPTTLVKVPLSIGKAGRFSGFFYPDGYHVYYFTLDFYAWTAGTKTFTGLTSNGAALPDVVAMGSWGPLNYSIPSLPYSRCRPAQ
jgi:hypothetical protein